jgi:hypothetical protein
LADFSMPGGAERVLEQRAESDRDAEITLVDVTLYLTEGEELRTQLPSDSEILQHLFEALIMQTNSVLSASKMLQIPLEAGHRAYSFCSERLLAIETCPPVLIVPRAGGEAVLAEKPPESPPPAELTRPGPSVVYEVVESDQRVVEQEEERFKLKAKTDWSDPNHGVARSYYIGEYHAGIMGMSHDGLLLVDVNIPAELRGLRYHGRIVADSLKFFREQGHRVEAIRGQYARSRDYTDGVSTNLTVFIDAYLKQQMTLEDAALAAPAGRTAHAHGFSEVVVMDMPSKGWNPVNDRPAYIESLLLRYYTAERTEPENRANQFCVERGENHCVARQALHRLYLEQLDTVAKAAASGSSREPIAGDGWHLPPAPQTTILNYILPDHLYGRFKSLATCMMGSDIARKLSSRVVAHLACPANEAVHREADNGSDYTMIVMLGDDSAAEGAVLELGDHQGEGSTQATSLRRGDVVAFPSSVAYKLQPLVEDVCELIVIEWWRHGRNFIDKRMTPLEFSDPLLVLANRQLGDRRSSG